MGLFSKIKLSQVLDAKPVSDKFGFDRGQPIDRYYIEKFLKANSPSIKGTVLEIAENTYTKKFGSANVVSKVLHSTPTQNESDIIADLCNVSTLPSQTIDCFICTQTFNFIYNFQDAIKGSHYLLKPSGVLLATVACMSPISKYDADRWGDYWRFTPQSCIRAFGEVFGERNIDVSPLGNSAAAALFMKGYAQEDLKKSVDLDFNDELFPLIIGIKAVK